MAGNNFYITRKKTLLKQNWKNNVYKKKHKQIKILKKNKKWETYKKHINTKKNGNDKTKHKTNKN